MEKLIWFYNQETTPNCFVLQFIGTTNYKTAYLESYKSLWISKVDFYPNSKLFCPISLFLLIEVYKQFETDGVLTPMIWCLECLRSGYSNH
jgi:hypothetical protein